MMHVTSSRTLLAAAVLTTGLSAGLLSAAPASADPVTDLLGQVTGQGSAPHHHRSRTDFGHTGARDGVLRSGCRGHHYRYVVKSPTHDWTLETFLRDHTGAALASGTYSSDSDPARSRAVFRFCRYSAHPGRFTIRAKLTWYNGSEHRVWFKPSHFRLRRP